MKELLSQTRAYLLMNLRELGTGEESFLASQEGATYRPSFAQAVHGGDDALRRLVNMFQEKNLLVFGRPRIMGCVHGLYQTLPEMGPARSGEVWEWWSDSPASTMPDIPEWARPKIVPAGMAAAPLTNLQEADDEHDQFAEPESNQFAHWEELGQKFLHFGMLLRDRRASMRDLVRAAEACGMELRIMLGVPKKGE